LYGETLVGALTFLFLQRERGPFKPCFGLSGVVGTGRFRAKIK
jgi:hypothetical protein